jgi:transposase
MFLWCRMGFDLAQRLVTDDLWALTEPLLPPFTGRRQGGGTAPLDERKAFTAVVYVLMCRCPWRQLPPWFDVSPATAHRRFTAWTRADLWGRLQERAEDPGASFREQQWAAAIASAARTRARRAELGSGEQDGPPPETVGGGDRIGPPGSAAGRGETSAATVSTGST